MSDLSEFLTTNPRSRKIDSFGAQELELLAKYKIPSDISDFLKTEGMSTYREEFFWTTFPQHHFQSLSGWGLPGKQCYAFLRTALGGIMFWKKDKIYRLDPFTGYVVKSDFDFCTFMNLLLTMDATLEATYFDVYQNKKTDQVLQYDEVFALVPALPLGGSFGTSRLEVVKMQEHLGFLAQLFNNKVRTI